MAPLLLRNLLLLALVSVWVVESHDLDTEEIKMKRKEARQRQREENTVKKVSVDIQVPDNDNSNTPISSGNIISPLSQTAKDIMDMINPSRRYKNRNNRPGSESGSGYRKEPSSIMEVERNLVRTLDQVRGEGTSILKNAASAVMDGINRGELNIEKAIATTPDILITSGSKQVIHTLFALEKQVRNAVMDGPMFDENESHKTFNNLVQPVEMVLKFLTMEQRKENRYNRQGTKSVHDDNHDNDHDQERRKSHGFHSEGNGFMDMFSGFFQMLLQPFKMLTFIFPSF